MRAAVGADLVHADSGLDCDTFNAVCRARLAAASASTRVREAISWFEGRPFSWWLGPSDTPSRLGELLEGAGLMRAETELAMGVDLHALHPISTDPGGLHIERVRSNEQLAQFARLLADLWTPPDEQVIEFYRIVAPLVLADDSALRPYVGYLEDRPVCTAEVTIGGGVVGLYNISTVTACRGRGFGTAVTVKPLLDALREGFEFAVLQAAAEGVGIYRKVGFEAYGEITEFKPVSYSTAQSSLPLGRLSCRWPLPVGYDRLAGSTIPFMRRYPTS
jgi:ribosomal protein S18 acetylase RimI-like enzyme